MEAKLPPPCSKHCWQFKEEVAKSQHKLSFLRGQFSLEHNFCPGFLHQQDSHYADRPSDANKQHMLLWVSKPHAVPPARTRSKR